jgi:hypothetical protein
VPGRVTWNQKHASRAISWPVTRRVKPEDREEYLTAKSKKSKKSKKKEKEF